MKTAIKRICLMLMALICIMIYIGEASPAASAKGRVLTERYALNHAFGGAREFGSDRIVNIYISTSEEDGCIPLSNIVFDIYKVAAMEQLAAREITVGAKPTEEEVEKYKVGRNLIATLETDDQGLAAFNFTEAGQPDGVYMIVERFSAATTGPVDPFYIAVPGTAENGGYFYTQNLDLQNVAEKGPDIRTDVTGADNNSDTFDVDDLQTWIIRGDVPADIGNARRYIISDVLDYRLTYQKESVSLKLYTRDGTELPLDEGSHYTLTEDTVSDGGCVVDRISISLTPAGMAYVAANIDSGDYRPEIRVYFNTVINQNAAMGTTIPNDAHLAYCNSAGVNYSADSDIPEVHTGGINILKTNDEDAPLAGATFMIAREASQAEMENETILKEVLHADGKYLAVVYVDFYAEKDLRGEKVYTVTTGEDGKAVIYGLAYGTYYLVETKAPPGCSPLGEPIAVVINEVSHLTREDGWEDMNGQIVDNTFSVLHSKFVLPDTGGMGTTAFTAIAVILIGSACILLLSNRRKSV